ncbi:hypothetical protein V8E36_008540 [Tilletia maclaganii]
MTSPEPTSPTPTSTPFLRPQSPLATEASNNVSVRGDCSGSGADSITAKAGTQVSISRDLAGSITDLGHQSTSVPHRQHPSLVAAHLPTASANTSRADPKQRDSAYRLWQPLSHRQGDGSRIGLRPHDERQPKHASSFSSSLPSVATPHHTACGRGQQVVAPERIWLIKTALAKGEAAIFSSDREQAATRQPAQTTATMTSHRTTGQHSSQPGAAHGSHLRSVADPRHRTQERMEIRMGGDEGQDRGISTGVEKPEADTRLLRSQHPLGPQALSRRQPQIGPGGSVEDMSRLRRPARSGT